MPLKWIVLQLENRGGWHGYLLTVNFKFAKIRYPVANPKYVLWRVLWLQLLINAANSYTERNIAMHRENSTCATLFPGNFEFFLNAVEITIVWSCKISSPASFITKFWTCRGVQNSSDVFEKIPRENGFNLISRFSSFSAASVTMVTVAFWLTTVPTWTCTCSTAGRERHPDTCSDSQTHGPDIAAERGQHIGMLNKAISFLFISNPDRTCGFR